MSNNPTPPRIEREAEKRYPVLHLSVNAGKNSRRNQRAFIEGAQWATDRAAPVVKALEKMYKDYHEFMTYKERMDLKQILQTYKADQ